MVPKIDNLIGISVYSTDTKGIGGNIRSSKDNFLVSEVLRDPIKNKISNIGNYNVYKLRKWGIDTNHALSEIHKKYGLRLKALGLKDANATTEQYVCDMVPSRSNPDITTNRYTLQRIGSVQKPLRKKDSIGNHFKIKIEDADFKDIPSFESYNKILNFYGYQRFGSRRPISHLVGKAIIQNEFEKAIEILISQGSEYDIPENNRIREMLKDKSSYSNLFEIVPPQMDIERTVLKEMILHGNPIMSLRALPTSLRRFFVDAFRSYIFNKTISSAYKAGEDLFHPQAGDICYDSNDNLSLYQGDPKQRLTIPQVGYSYKRKNRFDYYVSKILEDEEVCNKDFFVKEMQEVSQEGGYRNAVMCCSDFFVEEPYVSFTLSRGSYATILLREIIKPLDPISAGF